ncbi:hypothetical protein WME95_34250 [Sorangium sp. So ce327]|uniref:hypothetical protein n=1 Tax=Sorangium sp. So ce327 TaxID=3133301 RepID=UPI003F623FAE
MDALAIRYRMCVCPAALQELARATLEARSGGACVVIAGERFAVERQGRRGKPFSAVGPSGRIFVGEGDIVVDLAVPFLASRPLAEAVNHADTIAAHFAAPGSKAPVGQVQELDLCVDVAGTTFSEADRAAFVGRLRRMSSFCTEMRRTRNGPIVTGLHIGDRRNLIFALYNKTDDLRRKRDSARPAMERAGWMAHGWDGEGQVWRTEIRLRGRQLTELGLRSPSSLPERLDPVWQRFTRETLRLVLPGTATRRERCKTDPRWAVLQQAVFTQSGALPAVRMHRARGGATWPQVIGTMVSRLAGTGISQDEAERHIRAFLHTVNAPEAAVDVTARVSAGWARLGGAASETAEALAADRSSVKQADPRMMMVEHLIQGMIAAHAAGDVETARIAYDGLGWLIGSDAAPRGAVIEIGVARKGVPALPSSGARGPRLATLAASQGPACSSPSTSRPTAESRSGTRTERAVAPIHEATMAPDSSYTKYLDRAVIGHCSSDVPRTRHAGPR